MRDTPLAAASSAGGVATAAAEPEPPTEAPQLRTKAAQTRTKAPQARPSRPQAIVVPRLDVRAPVVPIVAVGRVLLPPSDPQTIGWWAHGAEPGSGTGSAVLTGHTVHSGGGAFDDLDRLRPGDSVAVDTVRGRLEYVVRAVTDYPKQTFAAHAAEVFSQEVPGRLVLITCENWNGVSYDSNAVVVAEPE